jgi:hypothetical protein
MVGAQKTKGGGHTYQLVITWSRDALKSYFKVKIRTWLSCFYGFPPKCELPGETPRCPVTELTRVLTTREEIEFIWSGCITFQPWERWWKKWWVHCSTASSLGRTLDSPPCFQAPAVLPEGSCPTVPHLCCHFIFTVSCSNLPYAKD